MSIQLFYDTVVLIYFSFMHLIEEIRLPFVIYFHLIPTWPHAIYKICVNSCVIVQCIGCIRSRIPLYYYCCIHLGKCSDIGRCCVWIELHWWRKCPLSLRCTLYINIVYSTHVNVFALNSIEARWFLVFSSFLICSGVRSVSDCISVYSQQYYKHTQCSNSINTNITSNYKMQQSAPFHTLAHTHA